MLPDCPDTGLKQSYFVSDKEEKHIFINSLCYCVNVFHGSDVLSSKDELICVSELSPRNIRQHSDNL